MSGVAHTAVALLQPGCIFFHCDRCKLADILDAFHSPSLQKAGVSYILGSEQLLITQDLQVLKHQLYEEYG